LIALRSENIVDLFIVRFDDPVQKFGKEKRLLKPVIPANGGDALVSLPTNII
jgi:hypothetical protein